MDLREFIHSPAVTCRPDTSMSEAAGQMEKYNVGSVIVTDTNGGVVGILTDRDIAIRGVAAERQPRTPVVEVMTKNVIWLREDADVFDAAKQMANVACRRLPVMGADGTLKGVVALDDLMLLFARQTDNLASTVAAESATGPSTRA